MRVGMLTGGGDCPGLNAVIRGAVRKGVKAHGHDFVGFRDGWRGPLENDTMTLGIPEVRGILPRGGTILGSSRTNPFAIEGGVERIKDNLAINGCDALIAIGGEDTLGVATKLAELGVNVVGVPKTIDNDLNGTDFTFGFDTAVNIAMEAIDRLHTTAESHHRAARGRGDGTPRRLDRPAQRAGRRREHHPDPRAAVRHRQGVRPGREPVRHALLADHRRRRGRQALGGHDGAGQRREGRVRARPARWHRRPARPRDRGAHRPGGPRGHPRPHPARRHARRRSTAGSPPGSACTPSRRSPTRTSA